MNSLAPETPIYIDFGKRIIQLTAKLITDYT